MSKTEDKRYTAYVPQKAVVGALYKTLHKMGRTPFTKVSEVIDYLELNPDAYIEEDIILKECKTCKEVK